MSELRKPKGLHAVVSRGPDTGLILVPHRHEDGLYVVSKTRFEKDYLRVGTLDDVANHARAGYSVRMSPGDPARRRSPSLIAPSSILGLAEDP
jgi:hypothetical protein